MQLAGNPALDGAQVLLANDAPEPGGGLTTRRATTDEIPILRSQAGEGPQHVLVVDPNDPQTALLAAPWLAYSGDLVVFDAAAAPAGLPRLPPPGDAPRRHDDVRPAAVAAGPHRDGFGGWLWRAADGRHRLRADLVPHSLDPEHLAYDWNIVTLTKYDGKTHGAAGLNQWQAEHRRDQLQG